jgi:hypothetical protein
MDFIKLNLSYLTSVNDGEYYVLNTNCSWCMDGEDLVKGFAQKGLKPLVLRLPSPLTKENLMAIQVDGFEVEVIKVMRCRDGIGYLVHFKIR